MCELTQGIGTACYVLIDLYTTSCNTQSNALEDGLDQRPKHVELV